MDGRDGFPQQGGLNSLCGLVIPNIETFEQLYPVRIEKHEMRCDSGGAGKYRGGSGVAYEVRIMRPVQLSFRGEGLRRFAPRGAVGGGNGALGDLHCVPDVGEDYTPPAYGIRHSSPCRFSMVSQGGGGWGDPLERNVESVFRDVQDGIVSREAARKLYGVVIDDRGIDIEATRRLRDQAR